MKITYTHTHQVEVGREFFAGLFRDANAMQIAMVVTDAIIESGNFADEEKRKDVIDKIGARMAALGLPDIIDELNDAVLDMGQKTGGEE